MDSQDCPNKGSDSETLVGKQSKAIDDEPTLSNSRMPSDRKFLSTPIVGTGESESIGEYLVLNVIAVHGQGVVYRANHPHLNRQAVIKVSKVKADAKLQELLLNEGQALAKLDHPNLARIYDLNFHNGCPYLVIEHIEGRNLAEQLESKTYSVKESCELVKKLADAMNHVHDRGIIHRDLKPANVVILADTHEPKIIDFGLAQSSSAFTDMADNPSLGGTIAYMPPEQANEITTPVDKSLCDHRSDIFALGAILYELLTGKKIHEYSSAIEGLQKASLCEIDFLPLEESKAPAWLRQVCEKALNSEPSGRYHSSVELSRALEARGSWPKVSTSIAVILSALLIGASIFAVLKSFKTNNLDTSNLPSAHLIPDDRIDVFLNGLNFEHRALSSGDLIIGPLFRNDAVYENDEMRINIEFDEPRYCFFFAVNPDRKVQLCYPEDEPDLVQSSPVKSISYPNDDNYGYSFTDGIGQVAFIVVESKEPLPSFKNWRAKQGDLVSPVAASVGSWIWKDGQLTMAYDLLPKTHRPKTRGKQKLTKPVELEKLLRSLENEKTVDVRLITFPVRN